MDEKSPAETKPAPPPEARDETSRNGMFGSLRFETIGSITAIVVGVAALYVSWDQGRVMRQEVRASVWPALQVDGFYDTARGNLDIGLRIQNAGVGPALIERITVRHRGEIVPDLADLRSRIDGEADFSFETGAGRILAAGDEVVPFVFHFSRPEDFSPDGEVLDTATGTGMLSDAWSVEVCYCSSLDQCWTSDTSTAPPTEVTACDAVPATDL
ncbi:hypothetical protein [Marinicauda pacifica]|jgi:hypothetical protein|uniref:hypothetical protein n=1 Tax=Marinicauda pacifica TaxID=1133559 RepID=UPI0035C7F54D